MKWSGLSAMKYRQYVRHISIVREQRGVAMLWTRARNIISQLQLLYYNKYYWHVRQYLLAARHTHSSSSEAKYKSGIRISAASAHEESNNANGTRTVFGRARVPILASKIVLLPVDKVIMKHISICLCRLYPCQKLIFVCKIFRHFVVTSNSCIVRLTEDLFFLV